MNENRKKSLSQNRSAAYSPRESEENRILRDILDALGDWRELTHAFHAYPGRMHPHIVRNILAHPEVKQGTLLDPFAGSGTTLVEGMLAGRKCLGNELHPLAVRIARVKTSIWTEDVLSELAMAANAIGENALELAKTRGKSGSNRQSHPDEAKWFQPHVRYELSNLIEGIQAVEYSRARDALEVALSSILVKVSNQRSDSSQKWETPNLSRGFTSRFFLKRCAELIGQLRAFRDALGPDVSPPRIKVGDARYLRAVEDQSVQTIITSPPYLGTYDYFSHQGLRSQILGIEDSRPRMREMGSRESGQRDGREAFLQWEADLQESLNEMARVTPEGADVFIVIGTSWVNKRLIENDKLITVLSRDHGFRTVGVASQDLWPEETGRKAQLRESLIWLQRDDRPFPDHLRKKPRLSKADREERSARQAGRMERSYRDVNDDGKGRRSPERRDERGSDPWKGRNRDTGTRTNPRGDSVRDGDRRNGPGRSDERKRRMEDARPERQNNRPRTDGRGAKPEWTSPYANSLALLEQKGKGTRGRRPTKHRKGQRRDAFVTGSDGQESPKTRTDRQSRKDDQTGPGTEDS